MRLVQPALRDIMLDSPAYCRGGEHIVSVWPNMPTVLLQLNVLQLNAVRMVAYMQSVI